MKTKIVLSLAVLMITSVQSSYSQFVTGFGLKAGTTVSNESFKYNDNFDQGSRNHVGYNVSAFADLLRNNNFNIETELGYDQRGYTDVLMTTDEFGNPAGEDHFRYDTHYISTGISAKFKYPGKQITPYLLGGPRMDIYLGYSSHFPDKYEKFDNPILEKTKKINYSISLGAGLEFNNLLPYKTFLEFNYLPAISTSFNNSFVAVKEYSFNVKLGINFIKEKIRSKK